MSEETNLDRRRFLGTAAMTIAAAQAGVLGSADAQTSKTKPADVPTAKGGRTSRLAISNRSMPAF
jgi:hypothetical protein